MPILDKPNYLLAFKKLGTIGGGSLSMGQMDTTIIYKTSLSHPLMFLSQHQHFHAPELLVQKSAIPLRLSNSSTLDFLSKFLFQRKL
jgi:hypothetical protein